MGALPFRGEGSPRAIAAPEEGRGAQEIAALVLQLLNQK